MSVVSRWGKQFTVKVKIGLEIDPAHEHYFFTFLYSILFAFAMDERRKNRSF